VDQAGIARSVAAWERMGPLSWRGVPCQQFPSDMLRYAEVLHELRPPWVLECGTGGGGAALFLAEYLADARAWRQVVSIDNDPRPLSISHPQLTLLKGDAADPDVAAKALHRLTSGGRGYRGVVLLDSDHTSAQVLAELDAYAKHADYLIVQDTLMGYMPQYPDNPRQAVEKWLPGHPEFAADPEPDPTNHPGGWLRRVSG
jgi:cephalosporin hydroxylase